MNSNGCVVILLLFLGFENVSGIICGPPLFKKPNMDMISEIPKQQQKVLLANSDGNYDSKETQDSKPQELCEWHHRYQNSDLQIATSNKQKWKKIPRLTLKVEKFDNNTEIYCEYSTDKTKRQDSKIVNPTINSRLDFDSNSDTLYKNLIQIEANETLEKNENSPFTIYREENQNYSFSCPEHSNTTYIQLGIINTTSNIIETFYSTHKTLNVTHNGTILCCIYYNVNETAEDIWISRVVANKTLLSYNNVRQDSLEDKEIILNTISQTIIITIAVAVVLILLVIIVICKKYCRKKPQSEAKVLYADLDLLRQIQPDSLPKSGPGEESPYAQIIGEMRPQTK